MVLHHPGEMEMLPLQTVGIRRKSLGRIQLHDPFADVVGQLAGPAHGIVIDGGPRQVVTLVPMGPLPDKHGRKIVDGGLVVGILGILV